MPSTPCSPSISFVLVTVPIVGSVAVFSDTIEASAGFFSTSLPISTRSAGVLALSGDNPLVSAIVVPVSPWSASQVLATFKYASTPPKAQFARVML